MEWPAHLPLVGGGGVSLVTKWGIKIVEHSCGRPYIQYPCPPPTLHNVEIQKLERRVATNRVGYVYIMNNKPFVGFLF